MKTSVRSLFVLSCLASSALLAIGCGSTGRVAQRPVLYKAQPITREVEPIRCGSIALGAGDRLGGRMERSITARANAESAAYATAVADSLE